MRFRDIIGLIYGTMMGTSTVLVKAKREYFFPFHEEKQGPWRVGVGGQCNLAELLTGDRVVTVNARREQPQKFFSPMGDSTINLETRNRERPLEGEKNHSPSKVDAHFPGDLEVRTYRFSRFFAGALLIDRVHRVIFTGPLLYAKIHPELFLESKRELEMWMDSLSTLKYEFTDFTFVPEEGPVGNMNSVTHFMEYLRDFSNESVEYDVLLKRYSDVKEITGHSALTEVLDHLRGLG